MADESGQKSAIDDTATTTRIAELSELIDDFEVAMFTTADQDGSLRSRPMVAVGLDMDGSLWFFASGTGELSQQLAAHTQVNVSFSDLSSSRFLSITGRAETVFDRAKAYDLWRPDFRTWFPQGINDPDLVMIRVRMSQAEYWESPSRTGVTLPGMVRAVVTGERQHVEEHRKIDFKSPSP